MRRYGKRQAVAVFIGATLSFAAAIFAILDEAGFALAGISLLMGLVLVVTVDNRQRLRDLGQSLAHGSEESQQAAEDTASHLAIVTDRLSGLNRRVTDLTGRLDAGDTRLLASIEAVRTDAFDRARESVPDRSVSDEQPAHSTGCSNS